MDKNEVLKRNRKDNERADERFMLIEQRMGYAVASVMMAVWAVLFVWDWLHGQSTSVGSAIMLSGVAALGFCQFYRLRLKSGLAFGILAAFGAVSFAVQHVLATM